MVGRELDNAMAEADATCALTGGAEEYLRRRGVRVFLEEMVLNLPSIVIAEPVCEFELGKCISVEVALAGGTPGLGQLQFVENFIRSFPPSYRASRRDRWLGFITTFFGGCKST